MKKWLLPLALLLMMLSNTSIVSASGDGDGDEGRPHNQEGSNGAEDNILFDW